MSDKTAERNSELLFEYLRSILYDAKVKPLDIDQLDEPFKKLGLGLEYLDRALAEMKSYSAALSTGNLSVTAPPRENMLCENLKSIHSNLNHLTWQAKQVAKGDYSQTVSFLGEFSEAFNSMTKQLEDRETRLLSEASKDALTGIGNRHYFFERMQSLVDSHAQMTICYCDLDNLKYINDNFGHEEGDYYLRSFVNTVRNRIRMDDTFARLGGDEFCIIMRGCTYEAACAKIRKMQKVFGSDPTKVYHKSFSCGILEVNEENSETDLTELFRKADALMYAEKKQHKKKLLEMHEVTQRDAE